MQDGPEACLEAGSASWDCSGDGLRGRNIGAAPSGAWSSGPGIHGRGTRDALLCAGPVGRVAGRARPGARLLRVSPAPRSVPAGSARHGTTRLLWRGAGCMGGGRPHSAHRGGCGGVPPDAYAGIRVRASSWASSTLSGVLVRTSRVRCRRVPVAILRPAVRSCRFRRGTPVSRRPWSRHGAFRIRAGTSSGPVRSGPPVLP